MAKRKLDPSILGDANIAAGSNFADELKMIDIDELHESEDNFFDVNRIEEFAETILEQGRVLENLTIPSKSELSKMLQKQLGYDENKAFIACRKFGDSLEGDTKREFISNNPQNEFSKIDSHVELKGENILAKNYDCLRVTPKSSDVPCLVYRDDNNNFAMLNPEKMNRKEMAAVIRESFGLDEIKDADTVNALVDKAEKVNDYYAKQNNENFIQSREYNNIDEIAKFDNVSEDLENSTFIRKGRVDNSIERLNKDQFKVVSTVDAKIGKADPAISSKELILSFSNKKNALSELQEMYKAQGLPDDVAKQTAKEVFAKAQAQSAEKVLQIEEINVTRHSEDVHGITANKKLDAVMTLRYGGQTEEIDISDRDKALEEIGEKFGVPEDEAVKLLERAEDKIDGEITPAEEETQTDALGGEEKTHDKAHRQDVKPTNGHEKNVAPPIDLNAPKTDATKLPDAPAPTSRRR